MKRVTSLVLALALCAVLAVPAWAAETGFTDVPGDSPFALAVSWAVERGVTKGITPSAFGPEDPCTISQILTFLWRAAGRPGDAREERAAVSAWAAGLGLEVPDLSAPCTRAAAVAYLWKAQGCPAAAQAAPFSDVDPSCAGAVSWAVEAGVTKGMGDGTFAPERVCTRGQIVTFLYRALAGGEVLGAEAERPAAAAAASEPIDAGAAWSIADNRYPTGTLQNGQPVTEEHVLALLAEAKKLWPDGMTWTYLDRAPSGNNIYDSDPSTSVGAACVAGYQVSHVEACGAFAAMLSDYVFGPSGNPARKLEDNAQVRPGDIVFRINPDGSTAHVNIAMTTAHYEGDLPCVRTADGNVGGKVQWFDTVPNYPTRVNAEPRWLGDSIRVIYTRYPE